MSDDTRAALRRAEDELVAAQNYARTLEVQLLQTMADALPAQVEELARRTAHSQPDVTKSLGKEGVAKLRAELASKAEELAATVRGGVDAVEWPQPQSTFSPVSGHQVQTALFRPLFGRHLDGLALIFKGAGFHVHDNNARREQGLVGPQSLFSASHLEGQFAAVAEALNGIAVARRAVADARAADDKDAVDELWT